MAPFLVLSLIATGFLNGPALAGDPAAGRETARRVCQTCHGIDGAAIMPMVANLTGQQELYLIAQLKAFKSGKRRHEQMSIIAGMLSGEDIENVAVRYSGIKITIAEPEYSGLEFAFAIAL